MTNADWPRSFYTLQTTARHVESSTTSRNYFIRSIETVKPGLAIHKTLFQQLAARNTSTNPVTFHPTYPSGQEPQFKRTNTSTTQHANRSHASSALSHSAFRPHLSDRGFLRHMVPSMQANRAHLQPTKHLPRRTRQIRICQSERR